VAQASGGLAQPYLPRLGMPPWQLHGWAVANSPSCSLVTSKSARWRCIVATPTKVHRWQQDCAVPSVGIRQIFLAGRHRGLPVKPPRVGASSSL
jgi:hypothetical protein